MGLFSRGMRVIKTGVCVVDRFKREGLNGGLEEDAEKLDKL